MLIDVGGRDVAFTGSMPDIGHKGTEQHLLPAPGSEVTLKQYEVEEVGSGDEKVPVAR